ncbi:MAG TPA: polyprenyl synthetase family protein [Acidimicrobiales bacterium]|nr:polyprenyl synthetase family protein [Acidimicrobiales bacterium]
MTPADLASLLALPGLPEGLVAVETELDRAVVVDRAEIEAPARRVVLGGGKRLRPALALACGVAAAEREPDAVLDVHVVAGATAAELVQAGSLIHDDIMDSAEERRGVPTINSVEGPNQALLVGDFLLARAGQLAAGVSREVAAYLAAAIADLCVGQSAEVTTLFDAGRSVNAYLDSIRGKTAALFRASCEIGAAAAGAPTDAVTAVAAYGTAFGMAFQIIDDVLDLVSTAEALGKPVGNDIREGVYSLPVLLALAGPDGVALRSRLGHAPGDGEVGHALALVRASAGVAAALDRARSFNEEAAAALAALPPSPTRDGLAALPGRYLDWALEQKAPDLVVATGG